MSEAKVGELPDTAGDSRPPQDTAKRRQILEGVRSVFRARGYDGAVRPAELLGEVRGPAG